MPKVADGTLEPGLRTRRLFVLLAVSASLAALQVLTILTDRAFASRVTTSMLAIDAAIALATLAGLVTLARTFLREPLRRAWATSLRNERRYRTLAQDSADLIGILSRSGFEAVDGAAAIAVLGFTAAELNALPLASFVHPDDLGEARACYLTLSTDNARASTTIRLMHKAGHAIWADVCLRRIELQNGETEIIATVRDVTQRHREAEELRAATAAAQRARAEADQASQAKTEFLACMSHEIRSPLSSVIGFASLLLQRGDLAPQARLYGERIRAAGKALLTVVDDILDFSRVEAGELELSPAPFSATGLIDECLSIVQQEALAKHLALQVSLVDRLPAAVLGDAARLRQVLLNLLYNAIKFTDQGSVTLEVRFDRSSDERDAIRFSIIDTGIGIGHEDLPRLFRRFAQVDGSIRRTYGGTGLGLAISKRLVELMGGKIGVDSEKNVGSTFWFALPLPAQDKSLAAPQTVAAAALEPRDVLLVEDVPFNQDLVRHILEAGDHIVDIVGNGAEAIMAVLDKDYDIVLMDIQMPHLDGLTTTRHIRQLPHRCRDVPIVAMTANALPEQTESALAAGMNAVLHKPFSAEQLYAVLGRTTGADLDRAAESGATSSPAEPDETILGKLAGLVGDDKVKQLLASLATSLTERFDADPATDAGRAQLKRQAHASVAGSGMLGFLRFAAACKALETAPEDTGFVGRVDALRRDADIVVAAATRLAESPLPLAAAVAA